MRFRSSPNRSICAMCSRSVPRDRERYLIVARLERMERMERSFPFKPSAEKP